MSKIIALTQGKETIVDDEDYEWLMQWKWYYNSGYVVRGSPKRIRMHCEIMRPPSNMNIDHINNNSLDNRRSNLRICTFSENSLNRKKRKDNTSGYKGVFWNKENNNWRSEISINGKRITVGSFENILDAARAYDEAARKYHGKFAKTNFNEGI